MNSGDPYTNTRLLYRCDRSIALVYTNYLKLMNKNDQNRGLGEPDIS